MVIYQNTFEDEFVKGYHFPVEDQYYAKDGVAVIADGITRDPDGVTDLSECSFEEMLQKYPRPSGGELAAKEIIDTFKKSNISSLKERLIECNKAVRKLNDQYIKKCDYLQNDYYGAVASCCQIKKEFLEYAYICDCGIVVYTKEGKLKFQTKNDKETYSDPYINNIGIPWEKGEARVIVRRDFRNNLTNIQNGSCVSYGAITGEDSAEHFIRCGKIKLDLDDIIVVYSDGFQNLLQEQEFIKQILDFKKERFEQFIEEVSKKDPKKYGKEKTLVIMRK